MVETLSQLFLNTVKTYAKPDLLAAKAEGRYVPISTDEFARRVKNLSLGLADIGLTPGEKLIILSENRPEWTITDFAVLCAGGITVPIYTSLMPEQVKYIINDSDARIVVCSNRDLWLKVDAVRSDLRNVHHFILIDEEGPQGGRQPFRGHGPRQDDRRLRPRALRKTGPGREAQRRGLDHLHIGDDGGPQGGHADPRQFRLQLQSPRRCDRVQRQGRHSVLPAPVATSSSG